MAPRRRIGDDVPGWLRGRRPPGCSHAHPVIDVQWSVATFTDQATIDVSGLPADAPRPQDFGAGPAARRGNGTVTLSYAGSPLLAGPSAPSPPSTPALQVNASLDTDTHAVTLRVHRAPAPRPTSASLTWDPDLGTPFTGQVGDTQVTIAWATSPSGEATLTVSIATPLPLAARRSGRCCTSTAATPGSSPGSYVVIDSAGPAGPASRGPVSGHHPGHIGGHGRGERLRDHGQGHPADPEATSGSTAAPCSSPRCGR